jgi:predicted DCC family thiol-disulfide oxidoreductase YuxK
VGPEGRRWEGAAAVERILDLLPRGRLVSWVFKLPFARPVARRAYRWFARHRHRFGCSEHCAIPS